MPTTLFVDFNLTAACGLPFCVKGFALAGKGAILGLTVVHAIKGVALMVQVLERLTREVV